MPLNRQKTHHPAHIRGIKVVINRFLLDAHDALRILEGGNIAERKKINTHTLELILDGGSLRVGRGIYTKEMTK